MVKRGCYIARRVILLLLVISNSNRQVVTEILEKYG